VQLEERLDEILQSLELVRKDCIKADQGRASAAQRLKVDMKKVSTMIDELVVDAITR
jgi:hypothetical protein